MNTYTIRIERLEANGEEWRVETPDTQVNTERSAEDLAAEMALLQTIPDGRRWRVQVWDGHSASGAPIAEHSAQRNP